MPDTMKTTPTPTRAQAATDLLVFVLAALVIYGLEDGLREHGLFPLPAAFDGISAVVGAFVIVIVLLRRRGQGLGDIGLRRPPRWWTIPAWAVVILVVNAVAQSTLVPALSAWLQLEPPDMSRYDMVRGNLPMLMLIMSGAMITGGFMEEVIYRGLILDRLARLFGGGRIAWLVAALLNGLPFGLIHFEWGPGGVLLTTVMGAVLGLMFLAAGRNLWPLIVAHAALDALLFLLLYAGRSP